MVVISTPVVSLVVGISGIRYHIPSILGCPVGSDRNDRFCKLADFTYFKELIKPTYIGVISYNPVTIRTMDIPVEQQNIYSESNWNQAKRSL